MLSDAMEDCIKAIHALESSSGDRVATSDLAEYLDVTPPTVSSTTERLADRGLVDREEYRGVTLTDEGELVALELLRHHRLLEAFLTDHLDYDWTEVHEEADRLEHHLSEELERRIAEVLDDPGVDPHGDPIPTAELELPDDDTVPLDEADIGDRVVVRRVVHRSDEALSYLSDAGIRPETVLHVADVAPFGMVTVDGPDGEQSLPSEVARTVRVAPAEAAPANATSG